MGIESFGLGFIAGVLSILSPYVPPLLPVVLGAAAGKHRYGPIALAAGLTISFVAVGLFIATIGFSIGLDGAWVRRIGGAILALAGLVLVVPYLQNLFAAAATPLSAFMARRFGSETGSGLPGQFGFGVVLGTVWSPCVGPTLGAASMLAAQGESLGQVAAVMAAFGLGAALPLVLVGIASRETLTRWRGKLMKAGSAGKYFLGATLIAIGLLIVSGLDKVLEAYLVEISPDWLTWLTTSV